MSWQRSAYVRINLPDLKALILFLVVGTPMARRDVSLGELPDAYAGPTSEEYMTKGAVSHQYSVVFEFPKVRPCILRYLRMLSLTEAVDGRSLLATSASEP